jgi:hypothetical protein
VSANEYQLFSEVFPIRREALPNLYAYRLLLLPASSATERTVLERKMGGKLAYRLRAALPGMWVWASSHLLTDTPPNPAQVIMAVEHIRGASTTFKSLEGIEEVYDWQADAATIADFVVRGSIETLTPKIQEDLLKTAFNVRNVKVEREFRARSWVVDNEPAVSLSVISRLLYEPDIQTYAATLEKMTDLVGLGVVDRTSSLQGEIIKIVGTVDEHRERLLSLTQRDEMAATIANAPGDHWVLRILSGSSEYDYVSDALALLVRLEDVHRFDVNPQHAEKALHLKPTLRAQMVKVVSDVVKEAGWIGDAYSAKNAPQLFSTHAPEVGLRFGNNKTRPYSATRLPFDVQECGVFRTPGEKGKDTPLAVHITFINALSDAVDDFMEALRRSMERDFHANLDIVRERKMRVSSQSNLESAVRLLAKEDADLMLVFLPDSAGDADEDGVSDIFAKAQTIGRGQPCLVIHESTMQRPEALVSVIIGILARAGVVPYILEDPLPYADRVVGFSLIKLERKTGDHLTGISRIYRNDGLLLRSAVASASVTSGFGLTDEMMASLFPRDLLEHKRVVLHFDGRMRREVLRALGGWEDDLESSFYPVEIVQRAVPRLYAFRNRAIEPPPWGTTFRLNDGEAFMITSTAPSDATPMPIYIRAEPPLTIEQAVHSAMVFTLFHYGALKRPKLPVTVHHADLLEASAVRGVLPENSAETTPFWL